MIWPLRTCGLTLTMSHTRSSTWPGSRPSACKATHSERRCCPRRDSNLSSPLSHTCRVSSSIKHVTSPSLVEEFIWNENGKKYVTGHCYRPRSEASEGYVFTGICLFAGGGGSAYWGWSAFLGGVCLLRGFCLRRGSAYWGGGGEVCIKVHSPLWEQWTRKYCQCTGGTHPTGMYTCYKVLFTVPSEVNVLLPFKNNWNP